MAGWHVDEGLQILVNQLKQKYPGIVIGTIGDKSHQGEQSDHNPEADGSVDAIDPMIGPHFTKDDANKLVNALVHFRDERIAYTIWNGRIISSTVQPWVWRAYSRSDPHTGHVHLSVNDRHHSNLSTWDLNMEKNPKLITIPDVQVPDIGEGDRDDELSGFNVITRIQFLRQLTPDGIWGPKTTKAVGAKRMTVDKYREIFGLS